MNIPWLLSLSATPSDFTASDMYCESCVSVSFGVLAGATNPNHTAASRSLNPLSANVGTSGNGAQRAGIDLPFEIGVVRHHGSDRPGERGIHCRGRARVGYVGYVDFGIT